MLFRLTFLFLTAYFYAATNLAAAKQKQVAENVSQSDNKPSEHRFLPDTNDQICDLWSAVLERDSKIQTVLAQSSSPEEKTKLSNSLKDVMERSLRTHRHYSMHGAIGLALTDPNLDPSYPLPGRCTPAYELPVLAAMDGIHGVMRGLHVAPRIQLSSPPKLDIEFLATRLVKDFYAYKRCSDLIALSREEGVKPVPALEDEQKQLRKLLVEIAGEESISRLDDQFRLRNAEQSPHT